MALAGVENLPSDARTRSQRGAPPAGQGGLPARGARIFPSPGVRWERLLPHNGTKCRRRPIPLREYGTSRGKGSRIMADLPEKNPDLRQVLEFVDEMIVQQRSKCLKIAHRINPRLTPDDLMNPFDWPEVAENVQFAWEDGLLAGLQSAHAAICARFGTPRQDYEVRRLETGSAPSES